MLLITGGEESHSRYILRSLEDCLVGLVDRVLLCLAGLVDLPALLLLVVSESCRLESCLLGEFPSFREVIYADGEYSGCLWCFGVPCAKCCCLDCGVGCRRLGGMSEARMMSGTCFAGRPASAADVLGFTSLHFTYIYMRACTPQ